MKQLIGLNTLFLSLFMLITLFLYSQVGQAQSADREGRKGPEHLAEMLELSEDKRASFLDVMKQQHEKRMAIREQYQGSRRPEKSTMDALHAETLQMLAPILTDDQLTQFEEIVKQHRPRHPKQETENRN